MSKVETGQRAQSSAVALLVQPALRRETHRVGKQRFIASDAVQIRLTVRLQHSTTQQRRNVHFAFETITVAQQWVVQVATYELLDRRLMFRLTDMFSEKNALRGWLMKICIHQHKLVVYYNSQICDEN